MKSFQFKDLMVNVAPSGERALFCGFGYTCNYGTYCGWITPCGFTCDVGRTCGPTVIRTQLQAQIPAVGCGFGVTCNYGTYCGFSIEPCGYTCDVGATHPVTRTVFEEQARFAGPAAAQAGAGQFHCQNIISTGCGASVCHPCTREVSICLCTLRPTVCLGCTVAITEVCRVGPTILTCVLGSCAVASVDPTLPFQGDPQGVATQLAAVKAQLQQELAAIEKQEKAVAEALRPQTVADVEELQGKLREAIAELDERKQELQKKSEKPKK